MSWQQTSLESLEIGATPLVRHFLQRLQLPQLFEPNLRSWNRQKFCLLQDAHVEVATFHYNRRSGLSRSGISNCKAARIRFCSASGRATRLRTNCWPSVVSRRMSPI